MSDKREGSDRCLSNIVGVCLGKRDKIGNIAVGNPKTLVSQEANRAVNPVYSVTDELIGVKRILILDQI